jgi:hypothetical protein
MADTQVPGASPARVCRWFGGKKAALSLRFDDSHPTHIEVGLPLLDEFGLVGTFLVNPGNDSYKKYQKVWEGTVLSHGHELADHTLNHRGAKTDAEADHQIGEAVEHLRNLQPQRRLITFEPGGATLWLQRKPFEFFDAKHHLFDINDTAHLRSNIMSCSEVYPSFSVPAFTARLEKTIAEGGWFQPHFHQIDETGHLRITPPVFRQVLAAVAAHRGDLWQAGIGAIREYQQERDNAAVWPQAAAGGRPPTAGQTNDGLPVQAPGDDDTVRLDLTCATDPNLYTQPLTLEVDLPSGTGSVAVTDGAGRSLANHVEEEGGRRVVRFDVPPVDARYIVRSPGLGAAARSQIREIRAPGAHPYVLFSAAEVPALLAKTSDPLAGEMWERIRGRADSLAAQSAADEPRSDQPWVRMGQELSPLETLCFAYAMTHSPVYAAAAVPRLEALAAEDWWYGDRAEMLNTSAAVHTMGLAYDWLYDALTDAQRAQVRGAIVEHGVKAVLAATEKGDWWTNWYHCNWGSVIYGEVGTAALSLIGEDPDARAMVRLSQQKIWHYTHSLNEDGSWGESATYGAFAWSNAILFADALRRVSGYDLLDVPRLRKLPMWFITLLEPGGANFVPFSNCQKGAGSPAALLLRLAREYRDGHAQFAAREMIGRRRGDSLAFLWCDPTVEPKPLSDLPLDTVFRDLDWGFLRSSREDPNATLFGLKGGHKEWDHSQHDTNSFVLYALGRPLLIDLFYPHDIWGVKTEAHNTVMVNGTEQAGRVNVAGGRDDPDHRGIVADLVDTPWYARMVGDASLAYERDNLTSFVREVMYLRASSARAGLRHVGETTPPDYFVMFDDIETPAPSRVDWLLHTYGNVASAGNTLTITQNDAAVDVTLIAPERFSSEVKETKLADIQVPEPFDGASAVKTIKLTPPEDGSRTFFLSVLGPRAVSAAPLAVTPVRAANVLGAEIASADSHDLALFALDEPSIRAKDVEAVGRSCFVRTSGGRVRAAVLHKGQRLSVGGVLLFETNSAGHAALTFGDDGVEAKLDVYDSNQVRIHVDRAPARVLVNGKERPFEYEADARCIKSSYFATREVRVIY